MSNVLNRLYEYGVYPMLYIFSDFYYTPDMCIFRHFLKYRFHISIIGKLIFHNAS